MGMLKSLPPPTPVLNRLRAAAALVPIIESGLSDRKLSPERAALMASFCEWAATAKVVGNDEIQLIDSINQGLRQIKNRLANL